MDRSSKPDVKRNLEAEVESHRIQIEALASEVSAEHLFVAVAANLSIAPEETISEATHGTVPIKLELLAYHLYPFFAESANSSVTPWHSQICIDALEKLHNKRNLIGILNDYEEQPNPGSVIIGTIRRQAEIIRGSAYPVQTAAEISNVQGAFENWFQEKIGLGPLRAVAMIHEIRQHQANALDSFINEVRHYASQHRDSWIDAKKKQARERTEHEKVIARTCKNKEAAWIFGFIQRLNQLAPQALPVSLEDISQQFDLPLTSQEWDTLTYLIGMTPDVRTHMSQPVEVRNHPLYALPDKRVLLIDVPTAFDVLWERFEEAAKSDSLFFQKRYQRKKARWLEDATVQHLAKIFPPHHIYQKLSYPDPDKASGDATTELDVAVEWGPFLILIEAKAKQFRFEGQLTDPGRLYSDLKANITDAFEQARRAARYIEHNPRPEFIEVSTGRKLVVQTERLRRIYLLTVSQHHLTNLATRLATLRDVGLFQDGEYPFSISIADLETVLEFCEGPDIFLHYIEKRLEIQATNLEIMADELDYWGAYLDTRLQAKRLWAQGQEKPHTVWLSGWSELFDLWYRYKAGDLDVPPKIKLDVPIEIHRILSELRQRKDDGARWIAFTLLAMSDSALATLNQHILDLHQQIGSFVPGKFRRVTSQVDDTVVSVVVSLDQPPQLLHERTALRVEIEKYKRKVEKSIGFGIMILDQSKPFECAYWSEGPWKYDPRIEKLLKIEPPSVPVSGERLPGRNEPCFCGSGRKYKACCWPKIRESRTI